MSVNLRPALAASAAAGLFAAALGAPMTARADEPAAPATTTAASAIQGPESRPSPRRQPIYFAFYSGGTATKSSDLRLLQPSLGTDLTISDVNWAGKPFSGSIYYGYKVGMFLPRAPRIGIELEFNHAKAYAKVNESKQQTGNFQGQPVDGVSPISDRVQEFRITNGINTINLNLLYRFPTFVSGSFPDGRLQPYVLVGPHYYLNYAINQVGGVANEDRGYRNNGGVNNIGYHLGAGLRYFVTPRIGILSEAKYYDGRAKVNINEGEGRTDLRTWHLTGGLMYNF